MNRNVESHFSMLPQADIKRSRFDRSSDVKLTFNVGELVPFFVDEVLPADTYSIDTSKIVRLQTLIAPVMDCAYLDIFWFFVANRTIWVHWKEFMGENSSTYWTQPVNYSIPQLQIYQGNSNSGTVLDYLGVPPVVKPEGSSNSYYYINALPWRAYQLIWNEWFRDQNLQAPVLINRGDNTDVIATTSDMAALNPYKVCKYHDYFTSALPAPQKGDSVKVIPDWLDVIATQTEVSDEHKAMRYPMLGNIGYPNWSSTKQGISSNYPSAQYKPVVDTNDGSGQTIGYFDTAGVGLWMQIAGDNSNTREYKLSPNNLHAAVGSVALNTINGLRFAFQLQKFLERDARGGTRYIELLRSHFGVTSPDARLQRPEYLGGSRIPLNVSQVVNNSANTSSNALGKLGAYSHTSDTHSDFTHSFVEHGYLIGLCCVRYDHTYQQGLERFWSRRKRTDFYWPEFANIGEQPILKSEIYATTDNLQNYTDLEHDATEIDANGFYFGFQEPFADYRYKPNRVCAEMRSGVSNSLDSWHFADDYASSPTLSSSWIEEDSAPINRCIVASDRLANQVFADIYVKCMCTRAMPMYGIPGLIDHH